MTEQTTNPSRRATSVQTRIVILAAVVLTTLAIAIPAALAQRDRTPRPDIVVFDPRTEVVETFIDLGEEGLSAGDTIVEHSAVVDPDSGESVGRAITRLQLVEVLEEPTEDNPFGDFEYILDCTVELDQGSIMFYGAGVFSEMAEGSSFTVIGGTNRYDLVRGTATVTAAEIGGHEGATIAFDLTRR